MVEITEKHRLIAFACAPNSSCYKVAKSGVIKYPTLKKYVRRHKNGLPLFEAVGRPEKLDMDSFFSIFLSIRGQAASDLVRSNICEMIKAEVIKTAMRRYPNSEPPAEALKIARTTLWRYSNIFINVAAQELLT